MGKSLANLGLYGLGTMGSALALNILDNGFALHVSNRTDSVVADFVDEAGNLAARKSGLSRSCFIKGFRI